MAGELDDAGRYAHHIVVVSVPRQSTKTTLAFDVATGRLVRYRDFRAAYTAQTGHATTARFTDRYEQIRSSPLADRVKLRRSAGTERITYPAAAAPGRPASWLKAFPPIDGALRGDALDLVLVDEAQEVDELRGHQLDATILPTFTTRPRRQLWLLGTAGDGESGAWFARYLTLARAGTPGVALVDYGADVDEDPADPAVWARRHPGLAAGLTDREFLAAQLALDARVFTREYLNVWPAADTGRGVLDPAAWHAARLEDAAAAALDRDPPAPAGLAAAVDVDGARAALAVAYELDDGRTLVKLHAERPETSWAVLEARRLVTLTRLPVTIDPAGPAGELLDALRRAGVPVAAVSTTDAGRACGSFASDVRGARLAHLGQPALDASALTAGARELASGAWLWRRRGASTAAVEAATLAVHAGRGRVRTPARIIAG